jgi:hypothetical protein
MGLFGKNPAKEANKYLDQIPGQLHQYYDPYIGAGQQSLQALMAQYGGLVNDPNAVFNRLTAGYTASPEYQFQREQGIQGMNRAAAAGGMVGSPQEQIELAKYVTGLQSQDFGKYADRMTGMYNTGLQGYGGINQIGYDASGRMAQGLKDMLESQASAAYNSAASNRAALTGLAGAGLGFALGGPIGSAIGSKIAGGGGGSGGGGFGGGGYGGGGNAFDAMRANPSLYGIF